MKLEYLRNLNGYSFEVTPTESATCGIIFYISNCLSYKSRFDVSFEIAVVKIYSLATLCWVNLDEDM